MGTTRVTLQPTAMSDERVVIEFDTEGIPETRAEIDELQGNALSGLDDLNAAYELFQVALEGIQGVAVGLYNALIDSNERLNAELLKSQTNLASNLRIYRDGTEIIDITEKITATQEILRESLQQIEVDTRNLVGVTTDEVNGVFQVLLQNSQSFIGQSKEFSNPIEAATASTKNWAAALGTLGLPLEQANQEIRSILTGDVNNPDSIIAKSLQISREQYDQWVANGELIDQLNAKLEVFTAGNALAARSIAGVTSNIQSLFEDTARLVGAPLLEPVVDSLNAVYKILNDNLDLFQELSEGAVSELVGLMGTLQEVAGGLGDSLNITPEGLLVGGAELVSNLIGATEGLIKLGGALVDLIGEDLTFALDNVTAIASFTLEGIGKLATVLAHVTQAVSDFAKSISIIPGIRLDDAFGAMQSGMARVTGEFQQSVEAVKVYNDITDVLLAQTDKIVNSQNASSESIRGQIEQLEAQKEELKEVKTFREEDEKAVKGQIEAIDKAIASLQGMSGATEELTFQSNELQEVGEIYDALAQRATAAIRQIEQEGSGDPQLFKDSVDALTELTEKQVQYGQITIDEATSRLEAILDNNKIEVEQREAALDTLRGLEEDFTDFKIQKLQQELETIELLQQTGEISRRDGIDQAFANENKQIELQIALLDSQIARNEELGFSTERLAVERQGLLQEQLANEVSYNEEVVEIEQSRLDKTFEAAIRVAEETEAARNAALTQGLIDRTIKESEFNTQQLAATRARLQAELAAEKANAVQLEQLLGQASTRDQRSEIQEQLNESRRTTQSLNQDLLDNELATQEAIRDSMEETLRTALETTELRFDQQELALRQSLGSTAAYEQAVAELSIQRIQAQLAAEKELQAFAQQNNNEAAVRDSVSKQIALQQSLLDAQEQIQDLATQAVQEGVGKRLQAVEDAELEQRVIIAKTVDDEEKQQSQLLGLTIDRLRQELDAERQAQSELAAIGNTEGAADSRRRQAQLTIDLINAERDAEELKANAVRDSLAEQSQELADQFAERRLRIRQSVQDETQYQAQLAELAVQRIQAELRAEQQAEATLRNLGDDEGVAESKRNQRELTIQLIEAETDAEEALKRVVDEQIAKYRERLELQQAQANTNLLRQELELEQAVIAGVTTKEQAEIAKLGFAQQRVQSEISLIQQLQASSSPEEQIANEERLAQLRLDSLGITNQINQATKDAQTQAALANINKLYDQRVRAQQEEITQLQHANQLFELQQQTVARANDLRSLGVDLASAQVNALSSGLSNELSLVEASLGARRQLAAVEEQLADTTNLSEEQKAGLLKERTALQAQLNALGENGQKSEIALIKQKQEIERQQLQSQQAQIEIEAAARQLDLETQRASIELDLVRAANKANELQLEAELLQIKAAQLQAEAAVTEDTEKRNALLQQASALNAQAARTSEVADAQVEAAEQEAAIKADIIDRQETIADLQTQQQQDALNTQQTLLNAQQAFEASMNGFEPEINTASLDTFSQDIRRVKRELNEAVNVRGLPRDIEIPLNVKPANIDVKVNDNGLSSSIGKLNSTLGVLPNSVSNIRSSVSGLGSKLDSIKRAVETTSNSGGSGGTTTVKPQITNQITVSVDKSGNATVDSQSLIDERVAEGRGC